MIAPTCTVRGCGQRLDLGGRQAVCSRGHSFDRARAGFWNLLQPQDRRSPQPGDRREAALARRARVVAGEEAPFVAALVAAIADALAGASTSEALSWLDVGCGEGALTAAAERGLATHGWTFDRHGVDLSVAAIELAARSDPQATWVVANADRGLPWPDASFALVTSCNARLPRCELLRVLAPGGLLVVAVPGPDDLSELRAILHGEATALPGLARTLPRLLGQATTSGPASGPASGQPSGQASTAEQPPQLALLTQRRVRFAVALDAEGIAALLSGSYRGMRRRERERLAAVLGSVDDPSSVEVDAKVGVKDDAEGGVDGDADLGGKGDEATTRLVGRTAEPAVAPDRRTAGGASPGHLVVTRDQEIAVLSRRAPARG